MDKLSVHAKKTFLSQRLIAWVCCLCAIGTAAKAYANNDPTFTVSAPENIEINKQFRLTFIVSLKSASNLNGNLNCSKELEHYAS